MTPDEAIEVLKTDCCAECTQTPKSAIECKSEICPVHQATILAIVALQNIRSRGKWVYTNYSSDKVGVFVCDKCRYNTLHNYTKFCPNCGSEMEM